MKTNKFCFLISLFVLFSCQKEHDIDTPPEKIEYPGVILDVSATPPLGYWRYIGYNDYGSITRWSLDCPQYLEIYNDKFFNNLTRSGLFESLITYKDGVLDLTGKDSSWKRNEFRCEIRNDSVFCYNSEDRNVFVAVMNKDGTLWFKNMKNGIVVDSGGLYSQVQRIHIYKSSP